MNYSGMSECDVLNGIGFRTVLFVSGCNHMCYNCQNPKTWDKNFGHPFTKKTKKYIFDCLSKDYIDGITITGGDPLYGENLKDILNLVKEIHFSFSRKTIWLYTGYTWEYILNSYIFHYQEENKLRYEILRYIDVLVDGEYIDKLKDLSLKFRGSSNQRLIDVQKSLAKGDVILWKTNQ